MFNVTVVNLATDAGAANVGGGPVTLGEVDARELRALLEAFAGLDPVENVRADPEIRIQYRRDRFIVRTGQRKLFLQDERKLSEPAYVLTAGEIIAEIDGSAAAKRTTPPMPLRLASEHEAPAVPLPVPAVATPAPSLGWRIGLIAIVLLLGGYVAYGHWAGAARNEQPELVPLGASERLAEDGALTGVYTTGGSEAGQHGIVILGDGKLKLFQNNAQAAPGLLYGSYEFGRRDGKVCLATDQPGGLIKVLDRDTLEFCGEMYRRVP